ncbi:MAG: 3-keto-5-aminohexanoate cleavage protein [Rhodospirillales bacterium]|nr:3-keto-5-aminohexanoate cleavage protein [Rhodospirillales bacterium]
MSRSVIITCAVTGGGDTVGRSDKVPVTPEQIANSAIDAGKAGASICHIHVRDPETGAPSMRQDLYAEVTRRIRESDSNIVINLTTGPGASFIPSDDNPAFNKNPGTFRKPEERTAHVEDLLPEVCSLDVATLNFGERAFVNVPQHLAVMAERIRAAGIKPELEVFDAGHLRLARKMVDDGLIEPPPMFQLCLGIPWGAPATPETVAYMKSMLPENALWAGFGISRQQMPIAAEIVNQGGHIRVGLEDNLYLQKGVLATNAQLVEKAADIIMMLGCNVAKPDEARAILGLRGTQ